MGSPESIPVIPVRKIPSRVLGSSLPPPFALGRGLSAIFILKLHTLAGGVSGFQARLYVRVMCAFTVRGEGRREGEDVPPRHRKGLQRHVHAAWKAT